MPIPILEDAMLKADPDAVVAALEAAKVAALDADPVTDDGTCNMDTPLIRLPGMHERAVIEIGKRAGVPLLRVCSARKTWYFAFVPLRGQADRRATMSEAAYRSLRDAQVPGMDVDHWQQMD